MRATRAATLALLLGLAPPAGAASLYVFGDSLSDSGNAFILRGGQPAPPYDRRASNGPTLPEQLATRLGLEAPRASREGGTGFAYSGARSGPLTIAPARGYEGTEQLAEFAARGTRIAPGDLVFVWLPANDLGALAARPGGATPEALATVVREGTANILALLEGLEARGARRFLLVTVPDRGLIPRYTRAGAAAAAEATAHSRAMNASMVPAAEAFARARGVELRVFDAFAAYGAIVADPAAHGFADARDTCWNGPASGGEGQVCPEPARFFFWDPAHPTTAGHAALAGAAARAMAAPPLVPAR